MFSFTLVGFLFEFVFGFFGSSTNPFTDRMSSFNDIFFSRLKVTLLIIMMIIIGIVRCMLGFLRVYTSKIPSNFSNRTSNSFSFLTNRIGNINDIIFGSFEDTLLIIIM